MPNYSKYVLFVEQTLEEKILVYLDENYEEREGEMESFTGLVNHLQEYLKINSEAAPSNELILSVIEQRFRSVKRKIKKKKMYPCFN